ncbi:penicillin-insensitive murein endopeptidase [Falsochrobactrum sp. TDYN1]|uniref:Penicillin-insensitive murein endopeptidase n=1 Tax=Falsochrobactrum tianjinense TaxID=2706015 RepID=A0A949PPR1_9HYPH|nr:penicillin-insensitive murein endopeptidase [Falsochrobactrum sp. TDYN1]MBV2144175.1 penicillin-insensitive murein endopeptidase [Falsochrobactrum sp. TDYN1]
MTANKLKKIVFAAALVAMVSADFAPLAAAENIPAKQAFGTQTLPVLTQQPQSIGFYAKGCLAGAVALPTDGPNWQVMRLSRNRRWGHPRMIALLEKLSQDAATDGWPGLLVGDISQPRGGPMLTGHASHQVGLDADIWLTPMPKKRFTDAERESVSAVSMLKPDSLYIDPKKWTSSRTALLKHAASYPEVERIFVHPGIKKKLCDTVKGNRKWLGKIRPYWGHHYHFHIRLTCQPGSTQCTPQAKVPFGDGCDQSLAWWFTDEPWKPAKPSSKPSKKPKPVMVSDLPKACAAVLDGPAPNSIADVTYSAQ